MEISGVPEGIESVIFSPNPLERAKGLQQIIDDLEDNDLKAEQSLPVIKEINRQWGLTDQEVGIIGTVFGPKEENPNENDYFEAIDGRLFGLSYLEMELGDSQEFMITIAVIRVVNHYQSQNPLAGPPTQRLTYHAPVRDNPLLMPMAS